MMKGRPRVATGGSVKGTTVMWGDYGLRMKDHHRRISAKQLKNAEDTIKTRLRGTKYRLYKRVACNVGVYVSGNEIRMGKGKGGFDHWAARVAVNQVVFEVKGLVHEAVVKDAFRLAGNKLPGQWEFVQKGEPPVVGITKLDGVTLEELKRPRKKIEPEQLLQQAQAAQTPNLEEYQKLYKESITDPTKFWGEKARELLSWYTDFQTVRSGSFEGGDTAWFVEGTLNACYNLVDRHAYKDPNRVAIIYEADEPDGGRKVTYQQLLRDVSQVAWVLREMGVRKGDTVAIYLPMIPEALVAILACIRLGAVHSVVFAGFSADSLRDRVIDGKSRVVITSDEGKRGGKLIGTKKIVDDALKQCPDVSHVLVYKRTGADVPFTEGRDWWWHDEVEKWPTYFPPVHVNAEDPLFLLYTSGSTGKPKGVMHTTAGYLLGAACTGKYVFDIHDGDRYFCGGD
ncbi:hypothetical protein BN1723_016008, partial [Verticillium longisporum]